MTADPQTADGNPDTPPAAGRDGVSFALAAAGAAAWEWDPVTDAVTFVPGLSALGLPPDTRARTGAEFLDLVHPDDREQVRAARLRAGDGGGYDLAFRLVRPDGTAVGVADRCGAVPLGNGKPARLGGLLRTLSPTAPAGPPRTPTPPGGPPPAAEPADPAELRYRRLFESSPLAVQVFAPDGRLVRVNAAWARLWGVTPDDIPGYNLLADDQLAARGILPLLHKAFAGEAVAIPENAYTPDRGVFRGQDRWVRTVAYPVKDAGRVEEVVLIQEDVTDQKRAEQAVRESENLLRLITNAAPALISYIGPDYRYRFANGTYGRWFGVAADEMPGRHVREVLGEEAWAEVRPRMARALAGEEVTYESDLAYRSGGTRSVRVTYTPDRDPAGRVAGFVVLVTDQTDAKRAQRVLDRYRMLSEHTRDIILFVRPDGRVVEANAAAAAAYGYDRDALLGLTIADLRAPDTLPSLPAQLAEANARGVTFETVHRRRDGTTFPVEVSSRGADVGGERLLLSIIRDVTDRKRAEEEGRAAREQLQYVTDTMPAFVARCDRDGRYVWVNRRYAERFGVAPERVAGMSIAEFLGEDAYRALRPYVDRVLAGETVDFEVEVPYRDGPSWMHVVYAPTLGPGGVPDGWIAVISDVTRRKQLEEAVRHSQERYRSFVEQSTEGIWRFELERPVPTDRPADEQIDHLYRYAYLAECNDAMARMYGFESAADIVGARVSDFLPREDPRNVEYLRAFIRSGYRLDDAESHEVDRFGRPRVFLNNLVGVAEGGRLVRAWGTQRDVTDRRAAEEALRASEERFRLALSSGAITVFEQDAGLRYTWVYPTNPGFPEQNIGRTDAELLPAAEGEALTRLKQEVLRTGHGVRRTVRVTIPGGVRDYDLLVEPRRDAAGRVAGVCGAALDVTDRVRAEEALREADRRKDEFLAVLAHELRNPLAPVRNAVQFLRVKDVADPDLRFVRDVIDRQVQQLTRLVDDLLDVSRITRGKVRLQRERVPVSAVVERAVETSRPLVDAARHRLTVTLPDRPVWLDADPARIAQVVSNLLNNAAKYTPPGGQISVNVECGTGNAESKTEGSVPSSSVLHSEFRTPHSAFVEIRVTDNGIGIPAGKLAEVFELFSQVDTALDRAQGGLGIGLTIVRRLVEMHGGSVAAHSEGPGRGSTFTVRLPAAPDPVSDAAPDGDDEADRAGSGLRILVVDDNVDSADSLAMVLRATGHEVRIAHGGPTGLEAAREQKPEVVLLDIGMPGMSGYEVARHLRESPETRGALLVAMTGWGQAEDRRRAREAGFDHHLVKPVDPVALRAVLAGLRR